MTDLLARLHDEFVESLPSLPPSQFPNRLLMEIECITCLRDAPTSYPDQPPTPREQTTEQVAP